MKKWVFFVLLSMLLYSQMVSSNDESRAEAEKLLENLNMKEALALSIEQMLHLQIQQNPALIPYENVMLKFFSKYMSYESLKSQIIDIYAEVFTASELKDINDFYATPTGKKTLQKMPELMVRGGQIGVQRVQDNIQELQSMIQLEAERIENSQNEPERSENSQVQQ